MIDVLEAQRKETGNVALGTSKATRVSHRPDEVQEYACVIVLQVGQVVGEVCEVIANAGLQVLSNMTIKRGQHAAAVLI